MSDLLYKSQVDAAIAALNADPNTLRAELRQAQEELKRLRPPRDFAGFPDMTPEQVTEFRSYSWAEIAEMTGIVAGQYQKLEKEMQALRAELEATRDRADAGDVAVTDCRRAASRCEFNLTGCQRTVEADKRTIDRLRGLVDTSAERVTRAFEEGKDRAEESCQSRVSEAKQNAEQKMLAELDKLDASNRELTRKLATLSATAVHRVWRDEYVKLAERLGVSLR